MTTNDRDHRPWFGPKRVGFGLRPQTWQGWFLTIGLIAIVIVIVLVLQH
jgi:Ni/Fe-hydrogenase subunit HybB-like protein